MSRSCTTLSKRASSSRCCVRPTRVRRRQQTHFVCHAILDVMELGEPDASGRRSPIAHRRDRDDGSRSRHHGARQRVEPDHQGLRAAPQDHQVGHHRPRRRPRRRPRWRASTRAATPPAAVPPRSTRRATARRRRARSSARSRSARPRSGTEVEKARALHRDRLGRADDPAQEDRAAAGHRRVHGQRPGGRPLGPGRPVRPRAADGRRASSSRSPWPTGTPRPAPSTSSSRAWAPAPS